MNWIRTTILLAALTGLLLVIGQAIGGQTGMVIALLFAAVMNFSAYWFSDRMVLNAYHAQEVTENEAPALYQTVQNLASRAQIPMPKVYIIEDPTPNAFATGRNPEHAAVAVTTGILQILTKEELAGVLAHELTHVLNRDTLTSTIAATLAGAIAMLANMAQWGMLLGRGEENTGRGGVFSSLLMIIVAPIAATLIQLAVSRGREYAADRGGAILCAHPLWLASALKKLETANQQQPMASAQDQPATAHLFIVNPLSGMGFRQLFTTHPAIEERIKRLEMMQRGE
jgi:heat shock protein HtpX